MREFNPSDDEFEYYEDTHNASGDYVGAKPNMSFTHVEDRTINFNESDKETLKPTDNYSFPMGGGKQRILVYCPKTPEDVTVLIQHLKVSDPAIVNLNDLDEPTAQRILDFLAGAVCALSGTVHRVTGNMFLLAPKGVETTIPYEQN